MDYYNDLTLGDTHTTDDDWYDQRDYTGNYHPQSIGAYIDGSFRVETPYGVFTKPTPPPACPACGGDHAVQRCGAVRALLMREGE